MSLAFDVARWLATPVAPAWISLAALILSVLALLVPLLENRQKIKFQCVRYGLWRKPKVETDPDLFIMLALLINSSRLPISVTEISFKLKGVEYVFEQTPAILFTHYDKNDEVEGHDDAAPFPINLDPLHGLAVLLYAGIEKGTFPRRPTRVRLSIATSRHRRRKTISASRAAAKPLEEFLSPDRIGRIPDSRRAALARFAPRKTGGSPQK